MNEPRPQFAHVGNMLVAPFTHANVPATPAIEPAARAVEHLPVSDAAVEAVLPAPVSVAVAVAEPEPLREPEPKAPESNGVMHPTLFDQLMHRYTGQERRFAQDANYVPSVAEFKELKALADNIHESRPTGEDVGEMRYFTGPSGNVDPAVAARIKRLGNVDTWVQTDVGERLFEEGAEALNFKPIEGEKPEATQRRLDKLDARMFQAELIATGLVEDTDTLSPEKFHRLAELSREARRQIEERGETVQAHIRAKSLLSATAPVRGRGIADTLDFGAMKIEDGRVSGRAAVRTKENPAHNTLETDEDTLAHLLADSRVISDLTIANALYPEKMAKGSTVYSGDAERYDRNPKFITRKGFSSRNERKDFMRKQRASLASLNPEERGRVARFTRQLTAIQNLEKAEARDVRRGVDHIPTRYEIARALFPEVADAVLTPGQQAAVEAAHTRLENSFNVLAPRRDRLGAVMAADIKEFVGKTSRIARVAGAAAMTLMVAVALMPAPSAAHETTKGLGVSYAQPLGRRSERNAEPDAEEYPSDAGLPVAGRKPRGMANQPVVPVFR